MAANLTSSKHSATPKKPSPSGDNSTNDTLRYQIIGRLQKGTFMWKDHSALCNFSHNNMCYFHKTTTHPSCLSKSNACPVIKSWAAKYPSFLVPPDKLPTHRPHPAAAPADSSSNSSTPAGEPSGAAGRQVKDDAPSAGRRVVTEEEGAGSAGVPSDGPSPPQDNRQTRFLEIEEVINNREVVIPYFRLLLFLRHLLFPAACKPCP